jgi:hypothetical protein
VDFFRLNSIALYTITTLAVRHWQFSIREPGEMPFATANRPAMPIRSREGGLKSARHSISLADGLHSTFENFELN